MNWSDYFDLVQPLSVILIVLLIMRHVRQQANPILSSVVEGLSQDAHRNAKQYAIAFGYGLVASLSAFREVFKGLDGTSMSIMSWHQYCALWAQVLNPFIVAVLAYAAQSDFKPKSAAKVDTNPGLPNTPGQ